MTVCPYKTSHPIWKLLVPQNIPVWPVPVPELIILTVVVPNDNLSNIGHRSIQYFSRRIPNNVEVVAGGNILPSSSTLVILLICKIILLKRYQVIHLSPWTLGSLALRTTSIALWKTGFTLSCPLRAETSK